MTVLQTFFSDPGGYILGFFITIIFLKEVWSAKDWICNHLGIQTKASIHQKEVDEKMDQYQIRLGALEVKMDQEIQEDNKINEKITVLTQMMVDMQNRNDEANRSKLKDRIGESYRHYHALQRWNSMEKDAFDDLIRSYEYAGGKDSFVHEICLPESYTWDVVDEAPTKTIGTIGSEELLQDMIQYN